MWFWYLGNIGVGVCGIFLLDTLFLPYFVCALIVNQNQYLSPPSGRILQDYLLVTLDSNPERCQFLGVTQPKVLILFSAKVHGQNKAMMIN